MFLKQNFFIQNTLEVPYLSLKVYMPLSHLYSNTSAQMSWHLNMVLKESVDMENSHLHTVLLLEEEQPNGR